VKKLHDKGIGNGISLIIMTGIISDIPRGFIWAEYKLQSAFFFLIEIAVLLIVVGRCHCNHSGGAPYSCSNGKIQRWCWSPSYSGEGARSYIPLRVNSAGVMPIIFAQAIMFVPFTCVIWRPSATARFLSLNQFSGLGV
jgi:preprotein translocase subunit SecY